MGGENIEGIIVSEGELELGREVANCASYKPEEDGGGCAGRDFKNKRHVAARLGITYESQRNQRPE